MQRGDALFSSMRTAERPLTTLALMLSGGCVPVASPSAARARRPVRARERDQWRGHRKGEVGRRGDSGKARRAHDRGPGWQPAASTCMSWDSLPLTLIQEALFVQDCRCVSEEQRRQEHVPEREPHRPTPRVPTHPRPACGTAPALPCHISHTTQINSSLALSPRYNNPTQQTRLPTQLFQPATNQNSPL